MKKVLLMAAIAMLAMGCCKKAQNGEKKECCKEGEKKECCQKAQEQAAEAEAVVVEAEAEAEAATDAAEVAVEEVAE